MGTGTWGPGPAKKAVRRVKGRIRQMLRPGNQAPWAEVREELNRVVRGWANYFCYGTRSPAYRAVDHYVTERMRYFLGRRHQVPSRGTRRYSAEHVHGALGVTFAAASSRCATCACPGVRPVREPDVGKPQVRFDEEE